MVAHLEDFVDLHSRLPLSVDCSDVVMVESRERAGCTLTLTSGKTIEICGTFAEVKALINLRAHEKKNG